MSSSSGLPWRLRSIAEERYQSAAPWSARRASRKRRSCETTTASRVARKRLLQLLDGLQVEVVRRLVEHEAVDAARLELGEPGRGFARPVRATAPAGGHARRRGRTSRAACARRPGRARWRDDDVVEQRRIAGDTGLLERAEHRRAAERRVPASSGSSPSRSASSVDLPLPFLPVTARRSPGSRSRSSGPSSKPPRPATAPSSRSTRSPSREPARSASRSSQGSKGFGGCSFRSRSFSAWRTFVRRAFVPRRSAPPVFSPRPAPQRPRLGAPAGQEIGQLAPPLLRLLERRPRGPPRLVPLRRVLAPAARELGHGRRPGVDLGDAGDRAVEEGAVVRDDGKPARVRVEEAFEAVEALEVEVVRRLVEQQHVEAREQDRGERPRERPRPRRASPSPARAGRRGRARADIARARASRSPPPRAMNRSSAAE